MAHLDDARLIAAGSGELLTLTVEVEIDWDRGDDRQQWELHIRFIGSDVGGDDAVHVLVAPVSPDEGGTKRVAVSGAGGLFDEDRGDDEIVAEVELRPRAADIRVVRTNTVRGDFSG